MSSPNQLLPMDPSLRALCGPLYFTSGEVAAVYEATQLTQDEETALRESPEYSGDMATFDRMCRALQMGMRGELHQKLQGIPANLDKQGNMEKMLSVMYTKKNKLVALRANPALSLMIMLGLITVLFALQWFLAAGRQNERNNADGFDCSCEFRPPVVPFLPPEDPYGDPTYLNGTCKADFTKPDPADPRMEVVFFVIFFGVFFGAQFLNGITNKFAQGIKAKTDQGYRHMVDNLRAACYGFLVHRVIMKYSAMVLLNQGTKQMTGPIGENFATIGMAHFITGNPALGGRLIPGMVSLSDWENGNTQEPFSEKRRKILLAGAASVFFQPLLFRAEMPEEVVLEMPEEEGMSRCQKFLHILTCCGLLKCCCCSSCSKDESDSEENQDNEPV